MKSFKSSADSIRLILAMLATDSKGSTKSEDNIRVTHFSGSAIFLQNPTLAGYQNLHLHYVNM